jgi:hypothetical protein
MPPSRAAAAAPWLLLVATLGAVAWYDLRTALPLGDEWVYRWTVERLASGHGMQLWPGVHAPDLVQAFSALPIALLTPDGRWLRLAVLPWLLLLAIAGAGLARRLGADPLWAGIAGTLIACDPLLLSITTGLMTDTAYLALLLLAAWAMAVWIEDGRLAWLCVLAAGVAALQRQYALGVPVAAAAGLWMAVRVGGGGGDPGAAGRRDPGRRDALWLLGLVAAPALAIELPYLLGFASATMRRGLGDLLGPAPGHVAGVLAVLPPMLGLVLLPLAPALLRRPEPERRRAGRVEMVPVALAVVGLAAGLVFTFWFGTDVFPGGDFGPVALGPVFLGGAKPPLLPPWLFYALEAAVTAAYLVLLVRRRRLWNPRLLGPAPTALLVLALTQLVFIPVTVPTDRYYLAVAAPLAPLLAAGISGRRPRPAMAAAALALVAAGVAMYLAGEADHQAWRAAQHDAALRAYAQAAPASVDAGYEENAEGVAIPAYEATGELPPGWDPITVRPPSPALDLVFAPTGDPRPGVGYGGPAPGRIVIAQRATR